MAISVSTFNGLKAAQGRIPNAITSHFPDARLGGAVTQGLDAACVYQASEYWSGNAVVAPALVPVVGAVQASQAGTALVFEFSASCPGLLALESRPNSSGTWTTVDTFRAVAGDSGQGVRCSYAGEEFRFSFTVDRGFAGRASVFYQIR